MVARRTLARTARFVLAVLLLAQAAPGIAACRWEARDASRAIAMAAGSAQPPCHESGVRAPDAGLCVGHCLGDRQSLDRPSVALSALASVALLAIVPPVSALAPSHATGRDRPLAAAAPPLRILFQSFLI